MTSPTCGQCLFYDMVARVNAPNTDRPVAEIGRCLLPRKSKATGLTFTSPRTFRPRSVFARKCYAYTLKEPAHEEDIAAARADAAARHGPPGYFHPARTPNRVTR